MSEREFLHGVPLVLNQKFYPLPRVHFRAIDIHIPADALQDEVSHKGMCQVTSKINYSTAYK